VGSAIASHPQSRALPTSAKPASSVPSYWLAASDGGVFTFGGLNFYGSMGNVRLNKPVVGMAATPGGGGYWLVAADGGIFTFGNAGFYGSMGNQWLAQPVVGMAATPDGRGYWLVAADGGIFTFGDAKFYGSMGNKWLAQPVVGMAATPDGKGYWLVARDGGIFTFGDAKFYGSTGAMHLNAPVSGMTATPNGGGYWLVAQDGGIFTFGNAPFQGSLGADPLSYPEVGMTGTDSAGAPGYWMTNSNGGVSSFGYASNEGSAPQRLNAPVVAMAEGPGTGAKTNSDYGPGSWGYDVSNWQCGEALPGGASIGIVQATGWSLSAPNPCIAQEAAWAGGGLDLYIFLTYGASGANEPGCGGNAACNYGFQAAQYAFSYAASQGVDPYVGWWLDIECTSNCGDWSGSAGSNDQVINGAMIELRGLGINTVGVYTSELTWNQIAGSWDPSVPVWVAWWTDNPGANCVEAYPYAAQNGASLPAGGIAITQYTDDAAGGFDGDYAC
jgi:hypothetical protein